MTGDNVILPAFFPPLQTPVQDIPEAGSLVKVREEDMKNVSEMDHRCILNILNTSTTDSLNASVGFLEVAVLRSLFIL